MPRPVENVKLENLQSVKPYSLYHTEELYAVKSPPMLIDGILPKQTVTGLTSFPGVGKTWLVFEFMRAIATGGKFLSHFQSEPGSVLFVGGDASVHDYARQWKKLTSTEWATYAPSEEEYESGNVPYNPLQDSVRFLLQSDFLFEDVGAIRKLIRTALDFEWGEPTITEHGPHWNKGFSLIVFDTLSALTRANQNDNSDMEIIFRNLRLISEATNAGILLLHHNGYQSDHNDGERWRGASAQIGALDNWFQINTTTESSSGKIDFKVKRFRGMTPESFRYKMSITEDSAKLEYEGHPAREASLQDSLQVSIEEYLNNPAAIGMWFTHRAITDALWDDNQKILFGDNDDGYMRFYRGIRNRLDYGVNLATPKYRRRNGRGRSNRSVYFSSIRENVNDTEVSPS